MKKLSVLNIILLGKKKSGFFPLFLGMFFSFLISGLVYQIYTDFAYLFERSNSGDEYQYLQINKEIGISNTLGLSNSFFSDSEIETIKKQPFIADVAPLHQNDYRVLGSFAGNRFDLFFNALEPAFLDVDTNDFDWSIGQEIVPVVVANDFVKIMNHAVLPSQGRPAIPKVAMKQIVIDLKLMKNGKVLNIKAQIMGFSDRVSSVIVPKSFLDYSNELLSGKPESDVSMVMIKVLDSGDSALKSFLAKSGFEVNEEQLISTGKQIISIVLSVLIVLGLVIILLSNALTGAQVNWLVAKNKESINMLSLLGYKQSQIIMGLFQPAFVLFTIVALLSLSGVYAVGSVIHTLIRDNKMGYPVFSVVTFIIPLTIAALLLLRTYLLIRKSIQQV